MLIRASSVALSADGNTALIGGYQDNYGIGSAWIFTRSAGVWTQQGSKLVGTAATGQSRQGYSVALSADGSTAVVGGYDDSNSQGAAWIYNRSGNVWSQQGSKLLGGGIAGAARFGNSVSISADGNTAIIGGWKDNGTVGSAWIYTRTGSTWSQQGAKLIGTGSVGSSQQGTSVAISADGNTAVVGGNSDNSSTGAVWVYSRSGTIWSQVGSKLVGTGSTGVAGQGSALGLSADSKTLIVGGYADNAQTGAAWVFIADTATTAIDEIPVQQGLIRRLP